MTPITLVACGVFRDALPAVLPPGMADIRWLDTALHAEPNRLALQLHDACRSARQRENSFAPKGDVRFLIGSACHPDMARLAKCCCSPVAPFANCIDAFVGQRRRELEAGRTMLITPGWVRAWPGRASAIGWDATDMRIQHGRYDRILLLDPGIRPVSSEELLELFDLIQVPIEVEHLDLGCFRKVVATVLGLRE